MENGNKNNDEADKSKRDRTACFAGHRRINKSNIENLALRLDRVIEKLTKQGIIYFGCGGAEGFDQLAAYAVIKAKKINPSLKLIMILPSKNHDSRWSGMDRRTFQQIIKNADKVAFISERYNDGCVKKRNIHLVKHSSICVAYMKYPDSNTGQIVNYACENGLKIINLADI